MHNNPDNIILGILKTIVRWDTQNILRRAVTRQLHRMTLNQDSDDQASSIVLTI